MNAPALNVDPGFTFRFWAKVDRRGPDECWPWTGYCKETGYGRLGMKGAQGRRAHRVAYELATGIVPGSACVLHRCDNPPCCNPAHLRLGTQLENIADREAKGRSAPPRLGEENHRTTLSSIQIREMRQRFDPDRRGNIAQAAREYGLSKTGAKDILRRNTWKHV